MKTKISKTAAERIMAKVSMPKSEFINEHKKLVKVLRRGSLKARRQEATDQAKELEEY
jgi:hypothetical protein